MPLLWHKMKIGIRRSISPFSKEGKGDLIFLLLRHSLRGDQPFFGWTTWQFHPPTPSV